MLKPWQWGIVVIVFMLYWVAQAIHHKYWYNDWRFWK